jgi:hypothetical protein
MIRSSSGFVDLREVVHDFVDQREVEKNVLTFFQSATVSKIGKKLNQIYLLLPRLRMKSIEKNEISFIMKNRDTRKRLIRPSSRRRNRFNQQELLALSSD